MNATDNQSLMLSIDEPSASLLEARLDHLFTESFDPILLTDLQGRVSAANRRASMFFHKSPELLKGADIAELLTPATLQLHWEQGDETFSTQVAMDDGRRITIHAQRLPGASEVQWILHDSSNRAELEQMQQDLTAMLMHDLQSPLGNVISSLELIRNLVANSNHDSVLHSMLDIAMRSSNHLQTLIASLLDISRLEAGHPISERQAVNIRQLVESVYEIEQPNFEKRGVDFVNGVAADAPPVYIEKSMISRVLLNLLDNALKQSQEGQAITIRSKETAANGWLTISVSDEGAGIPEAYRQAVFEKFERVHNDSSSKGLGLGLAFCRLAVEAHGGRIWVDDAPEGGARFQFTLPTVGETERLGD